jgi:ABC-type amino acid transport system permease subunit
MTELGQLASRPFPRASLRIRVWIALAIVYLMVAKPDLIECTVILAIALLVAVVGNMAHGRWTATTLSLEDAAEHRARTIGESQSS